MAAKVFIKASDAAVIGGVTVQSLGCSSGNEYPTKAGIVNSSGSFDLSRLENYDDDDFVLENDVILGQQMVELQVANSVQNRANVQLNDGALAPSVAVICNQGQTVVAKCVINDPLDLFLGWYDEEDNLISSDKNFTFTVQNPVSLIAKIAWLEVSENSLDIEYRGKTKHLTVSGNVDWVVQ